MKEFFDLDKAPTDAPVEKVDLARESGRKIMKFTWTAEGGFPAHSLGFVQWSVRPYRVGDGCDGTRDGCCHFAASEACRAFGIDYQARYEAAHPEEAACDPVLLKRDWAGETELPESWDADSVGRVLYDLYDMNNRSFADELEDAFREHGVSTDTYWALLGM